MQALIRVRKLSMNEKTSLTHSKSLARKKTKAVLKELRDKQITCAQACVQACVQACMAPKGCQGGGGLAFGSTTKCSWQPRSERTRSLQWRWLLGCISRQRWGWNRGKKTHLGEEEEAEHEE